MDTVVQEDILGLEKNRTVQEELYNIIMTNIAERQLTLSPSDVLGVISCVTYDIQKMAR